MDQNKKSFETTHWSLVVAAGHSSNANRQQALATLCERYWHPLYAYVRRQGYSVNDAQDLTQEFFCRLLEKKVLHAADRERGRFRNFLLASLKHFLANEWDRNHAQKRGGHGITLSLDFSCAEDGLAYEPSHDITPEKLYDRNWALLVLEHTLSRLRAEYVAKGRETLFNVLKPVLTGDQPKIAMKDYAEALNITEGAVKVAIHRLRQHYRKALHDEISQTTAKESEVDAEIRYLMEALSG